MKVIFVAFLATIVLAIPQSSGSGMESYDGNYNSTMPHDHSDHYAEHSGHHAEHSDHMDHSNHDGHYGDDGNIIINNNVNAGCNCDAPDMKLVKYMISEMAEAMYEKMEKMMEKGSKNKKN